MASLSCASPYFSRPRPFVSLRSSFLRLPFSSVPSRSTLPGFRASSTTANEGSVEPALLRRPVVDGPTKEGNDEKEEREEEEEWVDWEDQILEDTVPLVGFVRMILHSGKYESGDKLSPEHEQTILERLLPYHPECDKKIGCGIDFITVGLHPEYDNSRCLFIVRKDGVLVDFSYWKCIKGLIRKKYPLYADTFILRHFRRRRHMEH
ncbi:hypothetical protein IHE45_06G025700 [Dioscorea alata]|uniref:Uncharacterized protein n=1 Tax=Dioscorea alata TaxID=55571 RepID=A0ACB7VW11_DIOAL|nr:hypothetical protein IHE45_06G025700 [Dioscorea alata]